MKSALAMPPDFSLYGDAAAGYEFNGTRGAGRGLTPETRLMFAVLVDAMRLYQDQPGGAFNGRTAPGTKARAREDARDWLFDASRDDDDSVFSFASICATLALDKDCLRANLRESRREIGDGDGSRIIPRRNAVARGSTAKPCSIGTRA